MGKRNHGDERRGKESPSGGDSYGDTTSRVEHEIPRWIAAEGNLYWYERVILNLAPNAHVERKILDAFKEQHWAVRIPDPVEPEPFGDRTQSRRSALKNLNHQQGASPAIIFFSARDGFIAWAPAER